jgi:peptidyl-prolyl cis-trans isomerase SurA
MKKIYLIILFLSLSLLSQIYADEQSIILKYKVNDDLITNYDIIKEAKYLAALNTQLQDIDQNQLLDIGKNSLIKEKIKKYELEKIYKINYSTTAADQYIENFKKKLGFKNNTDFEIYLLNYETNIDEIKKKLIIELTWNKMIVDIYQDSILIDKERISETLEKILNEKKTQKMFELYEIVFFEKNKEEFLKKYEKIIIDIENLGFEKAAAIHSISGTANVGGNIGWVSQNQLSEKINNEVANLDLGSYTKPINSAGGSMILQLKNTKDISVENIDRELELSKIINAEKNRQLNEFSIIYYKKIENRSYVKEF